jgi:AraC-like DNA-binding protein
MLVAAEDQSAFHFSTKDVAPDRRLATYRELFRESLARFDTEALAQDFSCDARFRGLPQTMALRIHSTPVRVTWSRELVKNASQEDVVILAMFSGGKGNVAQRGREADVGTGNAILLSGNDPLAMLRTSYTYFSVPKATLRPLGVDVETALMSLIPADCEALRLLCGYTELLTKGTEPMRPELARLTDTHVQDLVALAIGASRDGRELAKGRGLRAARLRAIQADILSNLGSGEVRASSLAARHGVTRRYVHKLFESEGTTLSRFVLAQRLTRIHRMLADPRYDGSTIGALAYQAGFGDLSTFNREFRRRFGSTPSDVRGAARRSYRERG